MDYKGFLSHFSRVACVMSVNLREEGDIRKAMQRADTRMYQHKARYYAKHPEYEWHGSPA